ncbi:tyrosine-type recombinase/integrase [Alkalihalobacillus clausii]|uniref:tyrosine-type recombinase/integrase n=1 Tax=Shouchella clausii TaxID=79880 RepID=UPI001C23616C|nr:tyrosine-type recombinase/integrase [Shouchella clausii]MBU8597300.1 tyrosine-type recombinase/integrase [Shouchella clausii]
MAEDIRKGKRTKAKRSRGARDKYDLDGLFDKFRLHQAARGYAKATLTQYEDNYRFFAAYMDERGFARDVRLVTEDIVRDYIIDMQTMHVKFEGHRFKKDEHMTVGLAASTINTRLKTLRVMFKYLVESGLHEHNPMVNVKNVKETLPQISILNAEELRALFSQPDQRAFADFRDYTLMHLLLDAMLRVSEATKLEKRDVDFRAGILTVRAEIAKNRKERIIPLSKKTLKLMRELIEENEEDFDSPFVFLSYYGERLQSNHFRKRLQEFGEAAGIDKRLYPHLMRHTGATIFLENGGDLRHLQKLLGHSDLRTIIRYTHLSDASLVRQHAQYTALNNVLSPQQKPRKTLRK